MDLLKLTKKQLEEMIGQAEAEVPLEACGLLAGKDGNVCAVIPITNQAQSATRYFMEAGEQLRAFFWIEAHGLDLIGIYHSHPNGPEIVSATDIRESAYKVVQVVLSRQNQGWQAKGFLIEDGTFREADLKVD